MAADKTARPPPTCRRKLTGMCSCAPSSQPAVATFRTRRKPRLARVTIEMVYRTRGRVAPLSPARGQRLRAHIRCCEGDLCTGDGQAVKFWPSNAKHGRARLVPVELAAPLVGAPHPVLRQTEVVEHSFHLAHARAVPRAVKGVCVRDLKRTVNTVPVRNAPRGTIVLGVQN